ncbi:MAG: protein kinase [Ardenticatenaceae bacterium]|nr:protein kinase [Anaerolineales bacterium]MCB8920601.1 protein kinase [Ardenticatenaceae bacterium]MCB8990225.1 protein kinase [Ardenticatenaceae bacterium]MCB9002983.1 protein kinase [Ardenticatenaceae bacterium]
MIGKQIENYKVESVIGDGGMGTVCRAIDVDLDRPIALKVMHPQYLAQAEFQERFQQEAKAAARLSHPSIVSIYRFGRTADYLYIVMELVEGVSLGDYIQKMAESQQIVRLNETLFIMAQVADALGYAHRHGVIHRDIKPDNILIKTLEMPERPQDPPLRAVVTDFGLAKLMEGGIQTQTGTFIGTLPYMSPEQVLGKSLDGRSDIYSLGVVLYQLATGQLPFDIKTPTDAVLQHLNSQPPEPHLIRPGLPFAVERIILTALAKNPDYRYQTSQEMAQDLRHAAAQLGDNDIASFGAQSQAISMLTRFEEAKQEDDTAEEKPVSEVQAPPLPISVIAEPEAEERTVEKPEEPITPPRPIAEPVIELAEEHAALQPDEFAQVVVSQRDSEPRTYPLDQERIRIGRSPENELVIPSMGVSHFHALLEQTPQGWHISDLGSTNGVYLDGRKLSPHTPELWQPQAIVRISDNWLQLLPGHGDAQSDSPLANNYTLLADDVPPVPQESVRLRVRLPANKLSLPPGGSIALSVLVHNQGDFADSFAVTVEGLPHAWLPARAPLVRLGAGEQREVTIPIQPPRDQAKPGSHSFVVQVSSQVGPDEQVETPGEVIIMPEHQYQLEMEPVLAMTAQEGAFQIQAHNQGSANLSLQFAVETTGRDCEFVFDPPRLSVPSGQTGYAKLTLRPQAQLAGQVRTFLFTLAARPLENPALIQRVSSSWLYDGTAVSAKKPGGGRKILVWVLGFFLTALITFFALAAGGGIAEATGFGLPVLICPSITLIGGLVVTARLARGKKH